MGAVHQEGRLRSTIGQRRIVTDDGLEIVVDDVSPAERANRGFGGIVIGAMIGGMLAALGTAVLTGGMAAAVGSVGYRLGVERDLTVLSIGGLAVGMFVLVASFLVGGWVAGRIARCDGGRNGIATAVLFLIVTAMLGAMGMVVGRQYDVFSNIEVPHLFAMSSVSSMVLSILSVTVACAAMLLAGWTGGIAAARYQREADEVLAGGPGERQPAPDSDGHRRADEMEDVRELSREIREREMLRRAQEAAAHRGQMFRPRSTMVQRAEGSDKSRSPNLTRAERAMQGERDRQRAVASEQAAVARSDDQAEAVARESFTSAPERRTPTDVW